MDGYADEAEYVMCMRVSDMPQPRNPRSTMVTCANCAQPCWRGPDASKGRIAAIPTLCYQCASEIVVSGEQVVPHEKWKTEL